MAEEKEMTKEEQEKAIVEQMEKSRQVALKNLDSSLWNYASPKMITSEQYGSLSQAAEGLYWEARSKAPDQHLYEQLFLPQLMSEGGAITSPYLQNTSLKILQESLFSIKVEDAAKYFGAKSIGESFKGKYISQLGKEVAGQIVGASMQYQADEKVKDILALRQGEISSGLEKILAEPKKEEKKE